MIPQELKGLGLLILAIGLESFAQLFLKVGAIGGTGSLAAPYRDWTGCHPWSSLGTFWVVLGVIFYTLQIVFYTCVLYCLNLSVAFPISSLCFVGVAFLSKIFLGERVSPIRWFGIGLILAGAIFTAL